MRVLLNGPAVARPFLSATAGLAAGTNETTVADGVSETVFFDGDYTSFLYGFGVGVHLFPNSGVSIDPQLNLIWEQATVEGADGSSSEFGAFRAIAGFAIHGWFGVEPPAARRARYEPDDSSQDLAFDMDDEPEPERRTAEVTRAEPDLMELDLDGSLVFQLEPGTEPGELKATLTGTPSSLGRCRSFSFRVDEKPLIPPAPDETRNAGTVSLTTILRPHEVTRLLDASRAGGVELRSCDRGWPLGNEARDAIAQVGRTLHERQEAARANADPDPSPSIEPATDPGSHENQENETSDSPAPE
jgi:hypothetical protein